MFGLRPYVLIVDDAADGAESIAELLVTWGFDGGSVLSRAAALDSACTRMPFALILNLGSERIDRYAFVAEFRKIAGSGECLIVAIGGHSLEMSRGELLHSGIDHHISKPVEANLLRGPLERHRRASFAVPMRMRATALPATPLRPVTGATIAAYGG
jgi:two-component system CheB/CheR fusion protein